jgi:hypothetical protein
MQAMAEPPAEGGFFASRAASTPMSADISDNHAPEARLACGAARYFGPSGTEGPAHVPHGPIFRSRSA